MLIDPDASTRRDGKRLKKINLTENEWQKISKLIIILEDFARATEYLGGSKYTTISLMYSVLTIINQKILPDDNSDVEVIDLTSQNMAFDDDVGYKDAPEDEPISGQPIRRKININMPQNCINLDKQLGFASNSLHLRSQKQLRNVYQDIRILTGENQEVKLQPVSLNSLLARIFQDNITHVDKVANYLALPKIHHDDCPLT
ncbi:unnamed protein product [Rhizophagus irregularis]|nr:unnamed protein product [Rhizophagus irregularis]CAB5384587.1 unnamed protein product [Rhizophagus irregularis]